MFIRKTENKKIACSNDVPMLQASTFKDLGVQAKISVSQCIMGVWNWWGLEIFVFMAAYVSSDPTNALAAQTVLRAISQTCYMPTVGFRMATQMTVGKNIGAKRPEFASHYYRTAVKTALSYSILIFTLFMLFPRPIQMIFTQNEELLATMAATWFFFNTFIFFD